jgi:hypothetical protein
VTLAPLLGRVARGLATDGVRLERVRFSDEAHAQVLFSLIVGRRTQLFEGAAVTLDGGWRVTRATASDVLERLGPENLGPLPPTT